MKEKELSELPSSGLVNAQACEARIAEKIITARHKCGHCLAILSGESDQSGNQSLCFPEKYRQLLHKHQIQQEKCITSAVVWFPRKLEERTVILSSENLYVSFFLKISSLSPNRAQSTDQDPLGTH
jgi:hypothetical protein